LLDYGHLEEFFRPEGLVNLELDGKGLKTRHGLGASDARTSGTSSLSRAPGRMLAMCHLWSLVWAISLKEREGRSITSLFTLPSRQAANRARSAPSPHPGKHHLVAMSVAERTSGVLIESRYWSLPPLPQEGS